MPEAWCAAVLPRARHSQYHTVMSNVHLLVASCTICPLSTHSLPTFCCGRTGSGRIYIVRLVLY